MIARHALVRCFGLALALAVTLSATSAFAQRGGGGGGGGGGNMGFDTSLQTRLDLLTTWFTLDKDQKKAVKTLMDDAYKSAAPMRAGLAKARLALGTAVQNGAAQAEIDAAAAAYGAQATAMTSLEMKTLAALLKSVTPEQRRANAVQNAFYLMRGAFLNDKKWDEVPDGKLY
jgi:Spy/CpxP family protein refolding chaperone